MKHYLDKVQAIRCLVAEGSSKSLKKAVDGLDQLRDIILGDQVTLSFDDRCSVDSEFDDEW